MEPSEAPVLDDNWQVPPEKAVPPITVRQLDDLMLQAYAEQDEVDRIKTLLGEASKKLTFTKGRILSVFQEYEKTSVRTGRGTVVRNRIFSVPFPANDAKAKAELFAYLQQKKQFDALITINHNKLNSFYKGELEAAKLKGPDAAANFKIPGLPQPTYIEQLSLRRS